MLKRFFICFLVLVFFTAGAYAQDDHIHFEVNIHQASLDSSCSADFILEQDRIIVVSDLFPSSYVSVPMQNELSLLSALKNAPSFTPFSEFDLKPVLNSWLSGIRTETQSGIYTGDLFTEAGTLTKGSCSPDDILTLLQDVLAALAGDDSQAFSGNAFGSMPVSDSSRILAEVRVYDSGDYVTLTGLREGETVCTLSFDLSNTSHLKMLFGYAENGRNYYSYMDALYLSDHELQFVLSLFSDAEQLGFRTVMDQVPILREIWNVKLSDDCKTVSFSGAVRPQNDLNIMMIAGDISVGDSSFAVSADVTFQDEPDLKISVLSNLDNQDVSTEGLNEVTLTDDSVVTMDSIDMFSREWSGNFASFYATLLFALPSKYVEKILNSY